MSDPSKAVFLSYAREDTDAAKRIADALRSQGLEVWFDQNELVGGDTWDAKIRGQINSCALFVPVISANTQARLEGYFRLEWKLAEDRSYLMAKGKTFIVPVAIDATTERGAQVPDAFLKVQWTRLPGGETPPAFCARVKTLLGGEPLGDAHGRPGAGSTEPGRPRLAVAGVADPGPASARPATTQVLPRWMWAVFAAVMVAVGAGVMFLRPPAPSAPVAASAREPKPAPAAPAAISAQSVAVLAFANLSDDKNNEYFSDGISEELLNVLAKMPELKVSARTSAFHFKGKDTPIPEIARQLGVAYVVEGSVRKSGDKVRITAQLIKAADGFHVWSETYDRDLKDIFAVQDEIAGRIAKTLSAKLGLARPSAVTTNLKAYNLYLQARANLAKRVYANLELARQQFESALALDPDYSPARAGLATTYSLLPSYARSFTLARNRELYGRAMREARLVLEKEPGNAEAWMIIGYVDTLFEWRWKEASEAVARALALAPNDAEVANFAGDYFRVVQERPGLPAMEARALELNPLNPANHWDLGYAYFTLRDYEHAVRHAQDAVALSPDSYDAYYCLIWSLGSLKRFDEMRAAIAAARSRTHESEAILLNLDVKAAILEGRTVDALRLQEKITPYAERGEYSPADHGYHYLLLGESDQAAYWLRRACEIHDSGMVFAEPIDLDRIAADPKTRFVLDMPELKELVEIRARNARAIRPQP